MLVFPIVIDWFPLFFLGTFILGVIVIGLFVLGREPSEKKPPAEVEQSSVPPETAPVSPPCQVVNTLGKYVDVIV